MKVVGIVSAITKEGAFVSDLEHTFVPDDYITAVERAGGLAIILPIISNAESIKAQVALCDAIIMIGGNDVDPTMFGEDPLPKMGEYCTRMDQYQSAVLKEALKRDMPTLCVCRGMQMLNIVCGGTLYQDLCYIGTPVINHNQKAKKWEASHKITIAKESKLFNFYGAELYVNSYHHQSIAKLGKGIKVMATTSDGIVEIIEMPEKKFVLGLQWHPEMMLCHDDKYLKIFTALLNAC